jgi:uncharacterized ion transporter superfamily protein YfcC
MEKKKTQKKVAARAAKKSAPVVTKKVTKKVEEPKVAKVTPVKEVKAPSKHSLLKVLLLSILVVILLTWIIPSGTISGSTLTASSLTRTGINEMFLSVFYGANYYLVQIIFLIVVGIFYAVISKTAGYKAMISKIAKIWKGKEKLFVLVNSFIVAILTSMFTQPMAVVVFIPMLYSVAKKLDMNKMTTILMTFGSLLIGLMGTTYGTYGVEYINSYMGTTFASEIGIRFAILAIGYIGLNIFNLLMLKKKVNNADVEELYVVSSEKNNGKAWKYFLIFGIILVVSILGYIGWSTVFNVTAFTDFHTWLTTKLTIGKYPVVGYILGNITAFGSWDLFTLGAVLLVILIFVKIFAKITWDDMFDSAIEGIKSMIKPVCLITIAYAMFVICYWSSITPSIVYWLNNLTSGFSPYLNAVGNGIATVLDVDFGYTGFALGAFYAAKFADKTSQILTIMVSMNGLVSFIAPTSIYMLLGLSLSGVSYKEWFKYIWKFVLSLLVVLFVIFTIITFL